jgi:hypothetical protein
MGGYCMHGPSKKFTLSPNTTTITTTTAAQHIYESKTNGVSPKSSVGCRGDASCEPPGASESSVEPSGFS